MDRIDSQRLNLELERLCETGELPLAEMTIPAADLRALGFIVSSDTAALPGGLDLLDREQISAGLTSAADRWVQDLNVRKVTGSTNTELLSLAQRESIDGHIRLAELQSAGRGRRGRSWLSPIGQNLAISIGALIELEPARLGGLSLAVGLAAHDALSAVGAVDVRLKWPNDVLLGKAKLAGILVELAQHSSGTQVVVGIGVNVSLNEDVVHGIDQPVADLSTLKPRVSRNDLAARLISSVHDYLQGFIASGFPPMASLFNQHHAFHEQTCRLLLGEKEVTGTVVGVSDNGELMLRHDDRVHTYASGEVSLRST